MQGRSGIFARWIISAALAAAVLASILLLSNALARQHSTSDEIRQRFANVLALRQTEALLVDAETGQRGYMLTHTPSYLEPYNRARQQLPGQLDRLALAGVAGAGVAGAGDQLVTLAQAKMQELSRTLHLASEGDESGARAVLEAGSGKRYMDRIRAETARLVDLQQTQLDLALQRAEQYTTRLYLSLALLALWMVVLLWIGLRMMLRTHRLEAEAVRLREVEAAERETALVARELSHRVKNLFSVVLAIVQLGGRGSTNAREATDRISERIQALAHAHDVSLGADPMAGFDLEAMLRAILAPYVSDTAELELAGPAVRLPVMRATPLGLIFHELATNALKYGAWSANGGKVDLRWFVSDGEANGTGAPEMLRLEWQETSPDRLEPDRPSGFGSKLISAAVAQLGGSMVRERGDHGLSIVIHAPIVPVSAA